MITPLRSDVPPACADDQAAIADLHTDGVPPAVFLAGARVRQVVLLAQFVRDASRCGIQALEAANDLRATARVVGDLAQRRRVDPFAPGVSAAKNPAGYLRQRRPPASREGERKGNGNRGWRRLRHLASG